MLRSTPARLPAQSSALLEDHLDEDTGTRRRGLLGDPHLLEEAPWDGVRVEQVREELPDVPAKMRCP